MIENLEINELESLIRLCDRRKEMLYRVISTNTATRQDRQKYDKLFKISELLDKEFDKQIDELLKLETNDHVDKT